jgi:hypothetical protein
MLTGSRLQAITQHAGNAATLCGNAVVTPGWENGISAESGAVRSDVVIDLPSRPVMERNNPMEQPAHYRPEGSTGNEHTYLLRIWRVAADQPWRITLRRAGGQETQHFPSLTALVAGLWQQLQGEDDDKVLR